MCSDESNPPFPGSIGLLAPTPASCIRWEGSELGTFSSWVSKDTQGLNLTLLHPVYRPTLQTLSSPFYPTFHPSPYFLDGPKSQPFLSGWLPYMWISCLQPTWGFVHPCPVPRAPAPVHPGVWLGSPYSTEGQARGGLDVFSFSEKPLFFKTPFWNAKLDSAVSFKTSSVALSLHRVQGLRCRDSALVFA